jgi:hypothetical protein
LLKLKAKVALRSFSEVGLYVAKASVGMPAFEDNDLDYPATFAKIEGEGCPEISPP